MKTRSWVALSCHTCTLTAQSLTHCIHRSTHHPRWTTPISPTTMATSYCNTVGSSRRKSSETWSVWVERRGKVTSGRQRRNSLTQPARCEGVAVARLYYQPVSLWHALIRLRLIVYSELFVSNMIGSGYSRSVYMVGRGVESASAASISGDLGCDVSFHCALSYVRTCLRPSVHGGV
jgi:hypothetical protein